MPLAEMRMVGGRIIVTFELWDGKASLSIQIPFGLFRRSLEYRCTENNENDEGLDFKVSEGSLKVILKLYWGHLIF